MYCIQMDSCSIGHHFINLVPGQHFIRGNVKAVTDRLPVTQQSVKPNREIIGVGQSPQGGAITRNHYLFPLSHAVDEGEILPAANGSGYHHVVGVGWPDNGHGKPFSR